MASFETYGHLPGSAPNPPDGLKLLAIFPLRHKLATTTTQQPPRDQSYPSTIDPVDRHRHVDPFSTTSRDIPGVQVADADPPIAPSTQHHYGTNPNNNNQTADPLSENVLDPFASAHVSAVVSSTPRDTPGHEAECAESLITSSNQYE